MKKISILISFIMLSTAANSWDGSMSGRIGTVEVTGGGNYDFRVWISGSPELCGNDNKWAYINESDSNYSVYVSTLLAAKAAQQRVTIYTNRKDGDVNGYCHIGHIQVN